MIEGIKFSMGIVDQLTKSSGSSDIRMIGETINLALDFKVKTETQIGENRKLIERVIAEL